VGQLLLKSGGDAMDQSPVKPPTTFAEQLAILRKRNLTIGDDKSALSVLMNLNYYRFTGYLLPFKNPDNTYSEVNNDRLFAAIFICKPLFEPAREWKNTFLVNLQSLFDQYNDDIDVTAYLAT